MKRLLKVGGMILVVIALLLVGAITMTIGWRPFIGPKARPLTGRKFERTPERLKRGEYLVENLGCFDCHSEHDWTKHPAPMIEGTRGAGFASFPLAGLPGRIVASNITPDPETGAGTWSDDQLARAIREGIGHDGRALFPLMPYQAFAHMSEEDLASVIVYIRSIPPVHKMLPPTEIIFPVKYLVRSAPQPITSPVPPPDLSTPVKRGEYLVTVAGCQNRHDWCKQKFWIYLSLVIQSKIPEGEWSTWSRRSGMKKREFGPRRAMISPGSCWNQAPSTPSWNE